MVTQQPSLRPVGQGKRRLPILGPFVAATVVFMAALVIYPTGRLLYGVFFQNGAFSLATITETLAIPALRPDLWNTFVLLLSAGISAMAIGTILAWINERTDAQFIRAADVLPIVPLLVPGIAVAMGWVFLFAPRAGFLNAIFRHIFEPNASGLGATGPVTIYTMGGMAFVVTILVVPYVYLIMSAALQNVDPALEEASRMSGVGPLATFVKITLPAVRTAATTAAVLLIIQIMGMFIVPAIIGIPANVETLSLLVFRILFETAPPSIAQSIVISTFVFAVVQLAVLVEYTVGRSGHHATIGGRGHVRSLTEMRWLRWPARLALLLYLAIVTVLPLGALVMVSIQGFWTSDVIWDKLSLTNYQSLLIGGSGIRNGLTSGGGAGTLHAALANSLFLAVVTSTILMVMAALIAFFVRNAPGAMARLVNGLMTFPSTIPSMVIAVGFLVALGVGKVSLSGTDLLLLLAYLVLFVPLATRAAVSALSQIGQDLWESSVMHGATPLRTFVRILLPLMLLGLVGGWIIVFVHVLSETSAGIYLSGSTNPVVGPVILISWQLDSNVPLLAALTVVITAIQIVVVFAVVSIARGRLTYRGA